jgi:hypothetical protein
MNTNLALVLSEDTDHPACPCEGCGGCGFISARGAMTNEAACDVEACPDCEGSGVAPSPVEVAPLVASPVTEADVDAALACACRFPQSCAACARTMARLLDAVLFTSGEGLAAA